MTRNARLRVGRQDGFTLIEMLMALIIMGILTSAFGTVVTAMITHSTEITGESVLQNEARTSIDGLAREIRQAYIGDGSNGIESISGTAITFDSPDSSTPFHLRRISYRLNAGSIERQLTTSTNTDGTVPGSGPPWTWGTVGPWVKVIEFVRNPSIFTGYSDYTGSPQVTTNVAADVRAVAFNVVVATPGARGKQFTYAGSASVRSSPS